MSEPEQQKAEDFFDTTSPDSEAVKEFLNSQQDEAPAEEKIETQPLEEKLPEEVPDNFNLTWGQEDRDEPQPEKDPTKNMAIMVYDSVLPVTDTDKSLYLKAVLNNQPVELEIKMQNGMVFTVRSLSTYEGDVVSAAALWHFKEQSDISLQEALGMGAAEQYRLAMQLVRINGKPVDYVHFKFERGKSSLEKDAETLRHRSDDMLMNTNGVLYGLYMRAINVFNRKLNKLQDAAFSLNFWPPDSIG